MKKLSLMALEFSRTRKSEVMIMSGSLAVAMAKRRKRGAEQV